MVASTDALKDLQFHEAAKIFPLLEDVDEDEFDKMVASIRAEGLQKPIELCDGLIIDGRNRYKACILAQVAPRTTDVTSEVARVGGPAKYVEITENRRHMDKSQRAMCAARLREYHEASAKARQTAHLKRGAEKPVVEKVPPRETGKARDKAGEKFGVSGKLVDMGSKVLAKGTPEVVKAVDSGKLSVSAAAKIASMPKDKQPEAVKLVVSGDKPKPKAKPAKKEAVGKDADDLTPDEMLQEISYFALSFIDAAPDRLDDLEQHLQVWINRCKGR